MLVFILAINENISIQFIPSFATGYDYIREPLTTAGEKNTAVILKKCKSSGIQKAPELPAGKTTAHHLFMLYTA